MVWKRWMLLFAGALVIAVASCAKDDPTGTVEGEVLLDGTPLPEGVVHFRPVDGQSRTESTFISQGRFSHRVPVGKHRVEISCVKARPLRPGQDPDSATGMEVVPPRYNTQSELQAEVKKGKNEVRFDLSSK